MRFLMALAMILLATPLWAQVERTQSRLLYSFENASDTAKLLKGSENVNLITVQDNGVTEGKNCARLLIPKGVDYGSFRLDAEAIKNWSDFDYFAIDIMTEDEHPYSISFELWDAGSKNYATRFTIDGTKTRPGRQTLLYPINRARRNGKEGREWHELEPQDKINMKDLKQVKIFLTPFKDRDAIFWIDNLRLLQEDAAKPKLQIPLPKNAIAFNFGSAGTKVPGFTNISPTSILGKSDAGFTQPGLAHGGEGWPDLISGTFVHSPDGKPFTFQAKIPNGEYQLFLISGPVLKREFEKRHFLLKVNQKTWMDETPTKENYESENWLYRFMKTQYSERPHALWEDYIHRMFPTYDSKITVTDGLLKIECANHFLSAAILIPTKDDKEAGAFADTLRKIRMDAFEKTLRPLKQKKPTPLNAEEKFVLYSPNPLEVIRPWTGPSEKERIPPSLQAAGAPGQRLTLRLALTPFIDLGKCTVKWADFQGPENIPASAMKGYFQNYRYDGESLSEMALIPADASQTIHLQVEKGITQAFWFWMAVPEKAAAGKYSSTVTLTPAAGKPVIVPVELEVYPFELDKVLPLSLGMYYQRMHTDLRLTKEQLQFMRQIGFTAIPLDPPTPLSLGKNNSVKMQFDNTMVTLAKEVGLGQHPKQYMMGRALGIGRGIGRKLPGSLGAMVDRQPGIELKQPEFRSYFMNALQQYRESIEKSGLPVAVEIVDEPREVPNPWNRNLADSLAYAKMIREAGLRGFITPMSDTNAGKDYTILADHTDVISVHAWPASEKFIARTKKNQGTLWLYNTGMDRFSWGFYNWRVGSEGRWEWHFCFLEDNAKGGYLGREWYNPFTSTHGLATLAPDQYPGGMLFQSPFFDVSEGIHDSMYLHTLKQQIAACEKSGKHAATVQEAKAFLQALERVIPPLPGAKGLVNEADGALVGTGIADEARLQTPRWRAKIAELLKKMR